MEAVQKNWRWRHSGTRELYYDFKQVLQGALSAQRAVLKGEQTDGQGSLEITSRPRMYGFWKSK